MDGVLYENSITFAILIALSFFALVYNLSTPHIVNSPYFKWQIVLILFFAASLFWAFDFEQGKVILIAYVGRSILMLYIYSYLVVTGNLIHLCKAYIVALIITILHFFLAFGLSGMILVRADSLTVSQGWNANAMGLMCVVALFMMCYIIYSYTKIKNNAVLLAVVFFFLLFILMTGSKTCFFLILGTLMFGYFFKSKKKLLASIIVLFGAVVVYYLIMNVSFLYNIIGERVHNLLIGFSGLDVDDTSNRTNSDNLRYFMLLYGWGLFVEKPILGYGVGNFQALFGEVNDGVRMYAHNNFIELLVNGGIVGTTIYYWLYYKIIKEAARLKNHKYGITCISFMIVLILSEFGQVSYLIFSDQLILIIFMYQFYIQNKEEKRNLEIKSA